MSDRVINDLFIDNQPAKLYAPNIIAGLEDTDEITQLQNGIAAEATRAEARGAINFQSCANVDIYNNTFNGCAIGVGSSGTTYNIANNRFVDVTTTSSGTSSNVHDNMVNGTYVA